MAMRKILFLLSFMMPAAMSAQGDVEYRMEAGGGLGLVTYLGFRLRLGYGKLNGSS